MSTNYSEGESRRAAGQGSNSGQERGAGGQPATNRHSGDNLSSRMPIPEIAHRLSVGRLAVYAMLEQGLLPGIRLGRRWIVTRAAFEAWEKTCGTRTGTQTATGFRAQHEVTVN